MIIDNTITYYRLPEPHILDCAYMKEYNCIEKAATVIIFRNASLDNRDNHGYLYVCKNHYEQIVNVLVGSRIFVRYGSDENVDFFI